jgi:tetratricopeptide (TPR) repeat protein
MKQADLDIIFKDDFYQECGSPVLPIPFSREDMLEFTRTNNIAREIIADNLLQMVSIFPERINAYQRLLVHCCLVAGGEAAKKGNHHLSNHYFLQAAEFSPGSFTAHQNLARSFQHLGSYQEAINHYKYVIINNKDYDSSIWVYVLECLYAMGEIEEVHNIFNKIVEEADMYAKLAFRLQGIGILTRDNAPKELKTMFNKLSPHS